MFGENNDLGLKNSGRDFEKEIPSYAEQRPAKEFSHVSETQKIFEFPENKTPVSRKTSPKATVLQRILVAAVAVAAVVVYDLVGIMPSSGASVREYGFEAGANEIFYWIEFENYTSGDELSVEVYNDFIRHRQEVEEHFVSGEVYDLKPEMTYTVEVRNGNSVLLRKKVTTKPFEPYEEPDWEQPEQTTETGQPTEQPTEPSARVTVRDHAFEAGEASISYWIEMETYTPGEHLTIKIYNDSVQYSREIDVEVTEQVISGEIPDLRSGITYVVEVRSGDDVLIVEQVTPQTTGSENGNNATGSSDGNDPTSPEQP